ncbi:recombinase family protein [Ectobacillus sp. SYSU M60031]|uniref:Recombinase family protein n=2 Tax=Ectobacillus ponti TaxID=2961894 RepID=A0AA42BRV0_9BACI|nr:recombinase family protein [Ectobacillus ponti]
MQITADAPFRERLLPEEVYVIDEFAVSANKKSTEERPQMLELISLIQQGKVSTVYAFDRTRLFRNYYDGMEFQDVCRHHDVSLVYTSSGQGHVQATDSTFLEGVLLMFSNIEGQNIARRTNEVQRRCPPKKLGYTKVSESKQYVKHPDKMATVQAYFSALENVRTVEDLSRTLKEFRKKLSRTDELLLKVSHDPFYAGYDLHQGEVSLPYVEPYLTLEQFKNLQTTLEPLRNEYVNQIQQLKKQDVIEPLCGYCRQPLRYRINKLNSTAYYSCSRKHAKLCISAADIQGAIKTALTEIINKLDGKRMLQQSQQQLKQIRQTVEKELQSLEKEMTEIRRELLYQDDYDSNWSDHPKYKKIARLREEKNKLLQDLDAREQSLQENKQIVTQLDTYLSGHLEENASLLALMFIEHIFVYRDIVDFEVAKFDYLQDINEELTYIGGEAI